MRLHLVATTLLLIAACAGWVVPPGIGYRRIAAWEHERCVQDHPCFYVSICHAQSEARCLDAGWPKWCGNGEAEGTCGDALPRP